jgi:hypothetical protein
MELELATAIANNVQQTAEALLILVPAVGVGLLLLKGAFG